MRYALERSRWEKSHINKVINNIYRGEPLDDEDDRIIKKLTQTDEWKEATKDLYKAIFNKNNQQAQQAFTNHVVSLIESMPGGRTRKNQ